MRLPSLDVSVTRALEQTLWLVENSAWDKDRKMRLEKAENKTERRKLFILQLWFLVRGRDFTIMNGIPMLLIAFVESYRREDTTDFMNILQVLLLIIGCTAYTWAYAKHYKEFPAIIRDLMWVAEQLEPRASAATRRKCALFIRISQFVFWNWIVTSHLMAVVMVAEAPFRYRFPVGHRFPVQDDAGDLAPELLIFAGWFWEAYIIYTMGNACGWTDGFHCSSLLAITGLLKLLRGVMEENDFVKDEHTSRILLQCHQKLLNVGDKINDIMGVATFFSLFATFVVSIATTYCVLVTRLSGPGYISFAATITTTVFISIISEVLMESNELVGEAIYRSDWTTPLFTRSNVPVEKNQPAKRSNYSSIKLTMVMVQQRAARPLCVQSKYVGGVGNEFIMQYFKSLYTYIQVLLNFL